MVIHDATADDVPAFADIVIACWRQAYRGVVPDAELDRDTRDERIARMTKRLDWPWYAAVVDDRVVGFARALPKPRHGDAEIEGLYVHPDAARTGIGRALVAHACERFAAAGKRTLFIEALRDNRIGRAFYDRLGGRIAHTGVWPFAGVEYPTVGYVWDDVTSVVPRDASRSGDR
jgi:ribosomal protein S18 acetylase RimI-like enzyme